MSPLGFCSNPNCGGNTAPVGRTLDQHKNAICASAIASRSAGCRLHRSAGLYACVYACAYGWVRLWRGGGGTRAGEAVVCSFAKPRWPDALITRSVGRCLDVQTDGQTHRRKKTHRYAHKASASVHPIRTDTLEQTARHM